MRNLILLSLVLTAMMLSACTSSNQCAVTYHPVCCDGNTYDNSCEAEANGGKFCTEGVCDIQEECKSKDRICTLEYAPVCCDGKTYGNACVASANCATDCAEGACE